MMTSPKEQQRQKISNYDILFIKGGSLVDKSNRPLPFVNQENRNPPSPHDYKGQNTPWQIGLNNYGVILFYCELAPTDP